jgi:hypothetical protein
MFNKKVLIEALKKVNAAKAPAKTKDVDYNSKMGYRDDSPFRKKKSMKINTPDGTIDMSNTGIPLIANDKVLAPYSGVHQFDTNEVIETPLVEAKKGGIKSKKYSKSLLATNKLYKKNPLYKKKNYKSKTYDPMAMYFQPGGPINTTGPRAQDEMMEEYPINSSPKVYGNEPEDYNKFLAYNQTAPENRRGYEDYKYGDPNSYDHYGMWDALGKPKDFDEALKIYPNWQPDEYDGMYHGFSVNPNTGVFLKSGKPGFKPGDTTWMEIAGHYLSPRADMDTPVFDIDLQRFRYIPKEEYGGVTTKSGCRPVPPTASEIQSQVLSEGKGPTAEGAARVKRASEARAAWEKRCGAKPVTEVKPEIKFEEKPKRKLGQLGPQSFKNGGDISIPDLNQYKKGGYIEMKLTPEEIKKYVADGHVVHELPTAQNGQEVGPKDTIIYPPGDSEYMNQPPLNWEILQMLNQKARRNYEQYLKDSTDPTNLQRTSPAFQQKYFMNKDVVKAETGGYVVEDASNYKKGGALLTKKVTCKKCGWEWDAADGGNDMTTCHKCGGEGLIHAQPGMIVRNAEGIGRALKSTSEFRNMMNTLNEAGEILPSGLPASVNLSKTSLPKVDIPIPKVEIPKISFSPTRVAASRPIPPSGFSPIRMGDDYLHKGSEWYHIDPADYASTEDWKKLGLQDASDSLNSFLSKLPPYGPNTFKGIGDFNFKDFSQGSNFRRDMLAAAAGPQRQLSTEDFFTDDELVRMANQQADYWNARDQFDLDNPEDPANMALGFFTGDTSRDELFSLLYPNASMPNFRSKFMTPRQEKLTTDIIGPFTPSIDKKGMLSRGSLNSTVKPYSKEVPSEAAELSSFQKEFAWLMTDPAELVVYEMRGGLGLTEDDLENATEEQFEQWRQQIVNGMQKQAQKRYKALLSNPFTAGDAYSKMTLNKYGGSPLKKK